ncbi:hypothetical protein Tco_0720429 [Tanacetum coccineum]
MFLGVDFGGGNTIVHHKDYTRNSIGVVDSHLDAVMAALGEDHPNIALDFSLGRNESAVIEICSVVVPPVESGPVIVKQRMLAGNDPTLIGRMRKSDARKMHNLYRHNDCNDVASDRKRKGEREARNIGKSDSQQRIAAFEFFGVSDAVYTDMNSEGVKQGVDRPLSRFRRNKVTFNFLASVIVIDLENGNLNVFFFFHLRYKLLQAAWLKAKEEDWRVAEETRVWFKLKPF